MADDAPGDAGEILSGRPDAKAGVDHQIRDDVPLTRAHFECSRAARVEQTRHLPRQSSVRLEAVRTPVERQPRFVRCNLDLETAAEITALLERSARDHAKTLVIATHSRELATLGDRVLTIEEGHFVERTTGMATRAQAG